MAKYLEGDNSRTAYNFDPIFMGDGKVYRFHMEMNDMSKHNFFLFMEQEVVPRKCLRVVDSESDEPFNSRAEIFKEREVDVS